MKNAWAILSVVVFCLKLSQVNAGTIEFSPGALPIITGPTAATTAPSVEKPDPEALKKAQEDAQKEIQAELLKISTMETAIKDGIKDKDGKSAYDKQKLQDARDIVQQIMQGMDSGDAADIFVALHDKGAEFFPYFALIYTTYNRVFFENIPKIPSLELKMVDAAYIQSIMDVALTSAMLCGKDNQDQLKSIIAKAKELKLDDMADDFDKMKTAIDSGEAEKLIEKVRKASDDSKEKLEPVKPGKSTLQQAMGPMFEKQYWKNEAIQ